MACYDSSYVIKYEFFKHIDDYVEFEASLDDNFVEEKSTPNCSFITSVYNNKILEENIPKAMNICKKFVHLTELLIKKRKTATYNDYDYYYLNYWLNSQINKIVNDDICKKSFFQYLISYNNSNNNLNELKGKIHDIEEDKLYDMNILHILYKNHNAIDKKIKSTNSNKDDIIEKAKICSREYKKIKNICTEYETDFCKTLKSFKDKYEEINLCGYMLRNWKKEKLPPLTSEEDVLVQECGTSVNEIVEQPEQEDGVDEEDFNGYDIDSQSMTIATVATIGMSFICFITYRFTSFGYWLSSRIRKNENIMENLGEEINHFSHTSDFDHIESDKMYNIAYNSV